MEQQTSENLSGTGNFQHVNAESAGDTYMPEAETTEEAEPQKKKNKESVRKTLIRVVISLLVIAIGVFLISFFVAKASLYDSIGSMLSHMFGEVSLMWERIIS